MKCSLKILVGPVLRQRGIGLDFTKRCVVGYSLNYVQSQVSSHPLANVLTGNLFLLAQREEAQPYESINDLFEFPAFQSQKPYTPDIT